MLCTAIVSLILPALDTPNNFSILVCVSGIFLGAIFLNLIDRFIPHKHIEYDTMLESKNEKNNNANKIILFVLAIAIHNFPEGLAAGVGFGLENVSHAFSIALGIALQNIPEGMVIIAPMLSIGISKKKTLTIALLTGLIEVVGTLIGYLAVSIATFLLPFCLAFAGGTMLYVVGSEMLPETHAHGSHKSATYALLIGFCLMLVLDFYIG